MIKRVSYPGVAVVASPVISRRIVATVSKDARFAMVLMPLRVAGRRGSSIGYTSLVRTKESFSFGGKIASNPINNLLILAFSFRLSTWLGTLGFGILGRVRNDAEFLDEITQRGKRTTNAEYESALTVSPPQSHS